MLIYCPKCFTGYQIDEELISDKSRKVKCSSCGEVFDAGNLVAKAVDNSVNADVADTMEDITEEDAFEALAAMMREADLDDSSVLPVDKGLDEEKVVDDVVDPKDEVQQDLPNDSVVNHEVVAAEESFTIDEYNDIDQINELEHAQEQSLPKEDEILEINSVAEIEEKIFISDDIEKDTKLEEAPIAEEKTEEVVSVVVEDKKNTDDNNNDEINIDNIYERLSEHTSHLIERENKLPVYEKAWLKIKETLGFHVKIKW